MTPSLALALALALHLTLPALFVKLHHPNPLGGGLGA
jgi:hypothetical protein